MTERENKSNRKRPKRRGCGCVPVLLILSALGLAGFLLAINPVLQAIRQSQIAQDGGASHLTPFERYYLQYLLTQETEVLFGPAGNFSEPIIFEIEPGQGASTIAANLQASGALNNSELFLNYANYYGYDRQFEAGRFRIQPGVTIAGLAEQLTNARPVELTLRFLEGWRVEEMAQNFDLVDAPNLSSDEFLRLVRNPKQEWRDQYPALATLPEGGSLEGYLFPDTYVFLPEVTTEEIIETMLDNFEAKVTPDMRQAWGANGLTIHEAISIASIVQREAVVTSEKPTIGGVFLNRISIDMKLEADPTVQYALGYNDVWDSYWKSPLSLDDLRVDHPYNTYVYPGIPPGPIATPGLDSFIAVANPEITDYIFFVADCDPEAPGTHMFAITFDEHLANVGKCR
ncbi:MAG: endolytic transglycosylase MltG [Chloroflexota bacterium]